MGWYCPVCSPWGFQLVPEAEALLLFLYRGRQADCTDVRGLCLWGKTGKGIWTDSPQPCLCLATKGYVMGRKFPTLTFCLRGIF